MKFNLRHLLLFSFVLVTSFLLFKSEALAKRCSCIGDLQTKRYQHYSKHIWGTHRAWSCVYTCHVPGQGKVEIEGFHDKRYFRTTDNGSEGICDGIPLKSVYSTFVGWYIYVPQNPEAFDPLRSSAKNLKEWAKETCR